VNAEIRRPRIDGAQVIPVVMLVAALGAMAAIEPSVLSYDGLSLILIGTMPVILATLAQLFIMAAGDIDLGLGQFVGLVNVLVASMLTQAPVVCLIYLAVAALAYVLMGIVIEWRRIPAIVVTFGMGSIWLGAALIVSPVPGGEAPGWLVDAVNASPALIPLPIILFVIAGVVSHILLFRTRLGIRLRGAAETPHAAERIGISITRSKAILYSVAAAFALLAGFVLTGITGSGDPNGASAIVLSTVAAVIVGGGEFRGGRVNPTGAICAAVAIGLITSIMAFLNISAAYTSAVEGAILIAALSIRLLGGWMGRRADKGEWG